MKKPKEIYYLIAMIVALIVCRGSYRVVKCNTTSAELWFRINGISVLVFLVAAAVIVCLYNWRLKRYNSQKKIQVPRKRKIGSYK